MGGGDFHIAARILCSHEVGFAERVTQKCQIIRNQEQAFLQLDFI